MLKTKTGKQFECDFFVTIPTPIIAYIRVKASLATVASVFANPEETEQLWCGNQYISGYTKLLSLSIEEDFIRISLKKE